MITPLWAPIFKPLPPEIHRVLTTAFLVAWIEKNLKYSIAQHLPIGLPPRRAYSPGRDYENITGGKVWEAAEQFLKTGVSVDVVERLQQWGTAYTDRAARIHY